MATEPNRSAEEFNAIFSQALESSLQEHFLGKGDRVYEWPNDEAAAYRNNGGFAEGNAAVLKVRSQKVARDLLPLIEEHRAGKDSSSQNR